MDRAAQKTGTPYSGVAGIAMQDASLQESMGPVIDRSREHLTATDTGIIMARSRLMRAAEALADRGIAPPGTDPATHRVRSAAIVLPAGQPFETAAREALAAIASTTTLTVAPQPQTPACGNDGRRSRIPGKSSALTTGTPATTSSKAVGDRLTVVT